MNINKNKNRRHFYLTSFILILSIALVSFLAYKDILDNYFSGIDTFTLIETSQIHSFKDITRIFTERMTGGTAFLKAAKFYRPIAVLSYGIDYLIWKLNPLGYHLTDLMLHIFASVLVFLLIRFLTAGKQITAWIGAIVFTLHPILVESVPVNARRHDILASIFIMLAFLMFLEYRSEEFKHKLFLIFSILFYLLALGSKEIALIFPLLIFCYLMVFGSAGKKPFWGVLNFIIKKCFPYLMVTLIFILWRSYVLQGIGGYTRAAADRSAFFQDFITIITNYFLNLFVPSQSVNSFFNPPGILIMLAVVTGLLLFFLIILWFSGKFNFKMCSNDSKRLRSWKMLLFSLAWLLLPLIIYIWAQKFSARYMYIAIIPFSIMLSVCIAEGFHWGFKRLKSGSRHPSCSSFIFSFIHIKTVGFILVLCLTLSLLLNSPLLKRNKEWEESSSMSAMFFQKLVKVIPGFPNDANINIYALPAKAYIRQHSISSWLNLKYPGNRYQVVVKSILKNHANANQLYLKVKKRDKKNFAIFCRIKKGQNRDHRPKKRIS
ncbi:MAG: hypothetical protein JSV88_32900 [Candidatus Aminicenantes bacterium]|nr:MAG: hypothetical protein JSV88_32900 [Candidatus Aminicenantes bacterium]